MEKDNSFPALPDGFVPALLAWHEGAKRDLPWRADPAPYHVWISEIMLQQTRIEAVIPYYLRFLEELPTVEALAAVPDDRLMKLWQGLGYYSRARNLKKCAGILVRDYGGNLPADPEKLNTLPGIGAYTAGAIASIAYGKPAPAVDGNVLRVLSRLAASPLNVLADTTKKAVASRLSEVYPEGDDARALTESIMELGETVCPPNVSPKCENCPLSGLCKAHAGRIETLFPVKAEKAPRRVEDHTVLLLESEGKFALRRRLDEGLLAGLYEFPWYDGALSEKEVRGALENEGFTVLSLAPISPAKHIFTHIEWHMTGYRVKLANPAPVYRFYTENEIKNDLAVPTAYRRFLKALSD